MNDAMECALTISYRAAAEMRPACDPERKSGTARTGLCVVRLKKN